MKRFRDSSGRLTMRISDLCRETATEAAEYYKVGRAYEYHGRVYVLESIYPVAHFVTFNGFELFADYDRLGTFLPDVASEGNEITAIGGAVA